LLDINETSFLHLLNIVIANIGAHRPAELHGCFAQQFAPAGEVGTDVCAVCGFDGEAVVLDF